MSGLLVPFLLLFLAVGLLMAEDILPAGGALGLLALGCLALIAYRGFAESTRLGLSYLAAEVLIVPVAYGVGGALLRRTPWGRGASLRPPGAEEIGPAHGAADLGGLVDRVGLAMTPLRPSGTVEFDGRRIEAMAEEGLIDRGAAVRVVAARSGRLIVRPERG